MDETEHHRQVLQRALDGDEDALESLLGIITPVVQLRVARALRRRGEESKSRRLRADLEDLSQDVFVALFAHGAKALRAWQPERGLGLLSFVGFIAEREVMMRMRTAKRNPWTEDPTAHEDLEELRSVPGTTRVLEARELLTTILDDLLAWFTPEGRHYFELIYVEQRPVSEAAEIAQTTADAIYAWKGRMLKRARTVRARVTAEAEG